ncbi:uncharacterized protein [Diabrotica undecimpunctata]|uniref:uncharacterized protein n=1 Tax=Diabrotica undecimpunctata TaxID=50387 RepID=UPI003B6356C2
MSPSDVQVFVGNRISQIQELTDPKEWRHMRTDQNPADIVSRGIFPSKLVDCQRWWCGPDWLGLDEQKWPKSVPEQFSDMPETRVHVGTCQDAKNVYKFPFHIFGHIIRIKRSLAYCLRYFKKLLHKDTLSGALTPAELAHAMDILVKLSQKESWAQEIKELSNKRQLLSNNTFRRLSPFLDANGILRVGGRLQLSSLEYAKKHPALLSSKHPLTKLLVEWEHERLLHAGPQAVLSSIREQFWIIGGRNLVRYVTHTCVQCFKAQPVPLSQKMAPLPKDRVTPSPPFYVTGMDYAGPFQIKTKSPNFGGLWEAGVKSCKKHLKRILGNCTLTFEDFYTTLVQIEAILNSRPLCPLSSSPDDFESLTPSHFLIGRRLTLLPDPDVREVPMNRLSRYQHIQMLQQHFWTRWSSDYITELQQKGKWFTEKPNLEVGQLVVLKEDNLPPCQWKMGRVSNEEKENIPLSSSKNFLKQQEIADNTLPLQNNSLVETNTVTAKTSKRFVEIVI